MVGVSTKGLLHKIRTDFGNENHFVEVSVLDGNGDKFDVYSGSASNMTSMHLSKVFRDVGCFYMFTVLGIPEELVARLDQHQHRICRSEFCWLVQPALPRMEGVSSKCMCVGAWVLVCVREYSLTLPPSSLLPQALA